MRSGGWLGVFFIVLALASCRPGPSPTEENEVPSSASEQVAAFDVLRFRWHYQRFVDHLVTADGRVIDHSTARRISTSEGQSYGMWFALLANDPTTFENLLQWADANLAHGRLGDQLPAWLWGRNDEGAWEILDENPAVDADIWKTYALYAAAERWQEPRYTALAHRLSRQVLESSTQLLDDERVLLPAPFGFTRDNYVLLNPSYLTLTVFKGLAAYSGDGRWNEVERSSRRLFEILRSEDHTVIPDWLAVSEPLHLFSKEELEARDRERVAFGSYDAIRTYLWLWWDAQHQADPSLLHSFSRLYHLTEANGHPPERIATEDGSASGVSPIGFSAVLLPVLASFDTMFSTHSAEEQKTRIQAKDPARYQDLYYDQMLLMFGLSALECVSFLPDARLNLNAEGLHGCAS